MNSSNKYVGQRIESDSRMMKIVNMATFKDFAFAVSVLPTMPPKHFHDLLHGFNSLKALSEYCQNNGIAIYKTGICEYGGKKKFTCMQRQKDLTSKI